MNEQYEIVDRAIDSNGFMTSAASAAYINPEVWNKDVLRFKEAQLVITNLGRQYTDLQAIAGDTLNITVDGDAAEASDLTESTVAGISALTMTQVQFTPTERGVAYQVHDKERRRTFMDLMANVTSKIGYGLALKMEKLVIATVTSDAGNSVVANGVVASAIASSDELDEHDVLSARAEIKKDHFVPTDLVVSVGQEKSLLGNTLFNNADKFGARDVVLGGKIGHAFGVDIYWSDLITATASRSKALMFGKSRTGEEAFGVCAIKDPSVEMQREALGRYTSIIGVEDYDVQVLHANAICTIESYDAY